ncbi:MAG: hypothetical protein AAB088_03875, partial [Actinomycetota bacterium]
RGYGTITGMSDDPETANRRAHRVSIETVARAADVSIATVRRVMDHIGVHIDEVPAPQTTRQSDSINTDWATRFIREFPHFAHRARMPQP